MNSLFLLDILALDVNRQQYLRALNLDWNKIYWYYRGYATHIGGTSHHQMMFIPHDLNSHANMKYILHRICVKITAKRCPLLDGMAITQSMNAYCRLKFIALTIFTEIKLLPNWKYFQMFL